VTLQSKSNPGLLIVKVYRSHTITHTHTHTHSWCDYSERMISPSQRPIPTVTQQTQQADIFAVSRIQTRDPSNQELQTYAPDRTATGIRNQTEYKPELF
jgi:hypothetical protein